jgi:hypothetical protein
MWLFKIEDLLQLTNQFTIYDTEFALKEQISPNIIERGVQCLNSCVCYE